MPSKRYRSPIQQRCPCGRQAVLYRAGFVCARCLGIESAMYQGHAENRMGMTWANRRRGESAKYAMREHACHAPGYRVL